MKIKIITILLLLIAQVGFSQWDFNTANRFGLSGEMLPQSSWSDSTYWDTKENGVTIYADSITIAVGVGEPYYLFLSKVIFWTPGKYYTRSITVTENAGSTTNLFVLYDGGGATKMVINTSGTFTQRMVFAGQPLLFYAFAGANFTITEMSIKEVYPNHNPIKNNNDYNPE